MLSTSATGTIPNATSVFATNPNSSLTVSPAQSKQIECLFAFISAYNSFHLVDRKFDQANYSDFKKGIEKVNTWALGRSTRDNAEDALYKEIQKSRKNTVLSPKNFRPDLHSARVWFHPYSDAAQIFTLIYNETPVEPMKGRYKLVIPYSLLTLRGSSLRPFETSFISPAVQVKIRNSNEIDFVKESVILHTALWDHLKKNPQPDVYLPNPPRLFSQEEGIYFQPSYRVLTEVYSLSRFSHRALLTIFVHVGKTLLWLHSLNRIHNDCKPDNLFWKVVRNAGQKSSKCVQGLLNDFDLTCEMTKNFTQPFSEEVIKRAKTKSAISYTTICFLFNITIPLNDWCLFAQTVCSMININTFPRREVFTEIRNDIFKNLIKSGGSWVPREIEELPTNSPAENLKIFFQNAFTMLTYESIYFLFKIIGESNAIRLKAAYEQALKESGKAPDIFDILEKVLPTIPLEELNKNTIPALFNEINTPYSLEQMLNRLDSCAR